MILSQLLLLAAFTLNIEFFHNQAIGWVFFIAYVASLTLIWMKTFRHVALWGGWQSIIISCFTVINLTALISAVFVVWYRISNFVLILIYLLVSGLTMVIEKCCRVKNSGAVCQRLWDYSKNEGPRDRKRASERIILGIYALVWVICGYLLIVSTSEQIIYSPWQAISGYYLPLFFLLTIVLGISLVSFMSWRLKLAFIIAHSLLLHLYLPLSHVLPWGGDVWRHIGVEKVLVEQKYYPPVLFGPEYKSRAIFGMQIPEAFLIPNKYAYGELWGLTTVLQRTLGAYLVDLNIWLIPIIWSIAIPVIFFYFGEILFASRRTALFFSAASLVPFTFQALGSLSLPVSFGYLQFFWLVLLWQKYWQNKNKKLSRLCIALTILSLFGYTLHFFLLCLFLFIAWVAKSVGREYKPSVRAILLGISTFIATLFFPVIEFLSKNNSWPGPVNWLQAVKSAIAEMIGWYYAKSPLPNDILSGNIIFNQAPSVAFIQNMFTIWKWWIIPFVFICAVVIIYGAYRSIKRNGDANIVTFAILGLGLYTGYIFDWKVMGGEKLFIRRLDAFFAFDFLILLFFGLAELHGKILILDKIKKFAWPVAIFACSWVMVSFYASGPDMRAVSAGELDIAKYLWNEEQAKSKVCVLADSWILLALEGVSGRGIVEGGLPSIPAYLRDKYVDPKYGFEASTLRNYLKSGANISDSCTVVSRTTMNLGLPAVLHGGYYIYSLGLK